MVTRTADVSAVVPTVPLRAGASCTAARAAPRCRCAHVWGRRRRHMGAVWLGAARGGAGLSPKRRPPHPGGRLQPRGACTGLAWDCGRGGGLSVQSGPAPSLSFPRGRGQGTPALELGPAPRALPPSLLPGPRQQGLCPHRRCREHVRATRVPRPCVPHGACSWERGGHAHLCAGAESGGQWGAESPSGARAGKSVAVPRAGWSR